MKFYTSVAKGLKLKVRKFWGLIRTFVEVTGGKRDRGVAFWPEPPSRIGLKKVYLITLRSTEQLFLERRLHRYFLP